MSSEGIRAAELLGRASGGLLTTAQLLRAGASPHMAARQVRAGHWQRPARGVYVTSSRPLTGLDLGRTAGLVAGQPVVVSGWVPLRELGLRWVSDSDRVLALVPPAVRTPSNGRVVLRRTEHLDELTTWRRDGLTMAPVERAVVDAARRLPHLRDVRGVVLGAVADRWATVQGLQAVLGGTQRNGSALVRRALVDASRGCASPPEAELVDALVGCGRPFYVNPQVLVDGRSLGYPDVWFPDVCAGGEVESSERHGTDEDVEATYDRHERFATYGLELVHLSVRRIRRDPDGAARHLLSRAVGRRRGAEGVTVVPGGPLLR